MVVCQRKRKTLDMLLGRKLSILTPLRNMQEEDKKPEEETTEGTPPPPPPSE